MVIGVGVVEGGSVIVFLWQWGYRERSQRQAERESQ